MASDPNVVINSALNTMRRLPPAKTEFNLSGLLNLLPEYTDELLQRVDQPLQVATDATTGQQYLLCDYNRDGDSYRSPWSNTYDPPIDDGFKPSPELRKLETEANAVFEGYRRQYFGGGVSSVYLWDLEDGAFAGCFLVKKDVDGKRYVSKGIWDSIHVVEARPQGGDMFTYKLTTTVLLAMDTDKGGVGDVNISGSLTRQGREQTLKVAPTAGKTHIGNIGGMIEQLEIDIRKQLDELYIQKTRQVLNQIRRPGGGAGGADGAEGGGRHGGKQAGSAVRAAGFGGVVPKHGAAFVGDLAAAIGRHGKKMGKD